MSRTMGLAPPLAVQGGDPLHDRLNAALRYARASGFFVAFSGAFFFAGWNGSAALATRLFPGLAPMSPNGALGAMLAGIALVLRTNPSSAVSRIAASALAALLALLGAASLSQDPFGIDLGIDQLSFAGAGADPHPNRMAPNTALNLVLFGLALMLLDRKTRGGHRPARLFAVAAGLMAAQTVIGYAFGTNTVYGIGPYTAMALSTAVLHVVLSLGICFARPDSGMAASFLRETSGGFMLRSLLPTGAAVILALSLLELTGLHAGLYDHEFGLAALVLTTIGVLAGLIWSNARSLDRLENAARDAEAERARLLIDELTARANAEAAERRFRELLEGLTEIVWERDPETWRFTFVSERAERVLGYPTRRWIEEPGFWLDTVIHPEDREAVRAFYQASGSETLDRVLEYRALAANGRTVWLRESVRMTAGSNDRAAGMRGLIIDVTERKQTERRVSAQHLITRILADARGIGEAASGIIEAICECLDWHTGGLWLPDERSNEVLRCSAIWTRPAVHVPRFRETTLERSFAAGVGLPGRIWATGEPVWIRDIVHDANFPRAPIAASEGLHGAVGFPIRLGEETLGVLEFFSPEIREPDEDMLQMMTAVGNQLGQFLERKRAEAEVREGAERLRFALEAARTWAWQSDPDTGTFTWSENLGPMLGLPPGRAQATEEELFDSIHPDDRERVREAYYRALAEEVPYDVEYRVLWADRSDRWIAVRGRAIRDANGRAVRVVGVGTDITARKEMEEKLREESEAVEIVNRTGQFLSGELDLTKLVQAVTDAATHLTGAAFGAFFYNVTDERGEYFTLYTLSGASREAFAGFPMPRATELFRPTFVGERVIRLGDVRKDPAYGKSPPNHGPPPGHLPVVSYLAVPVVARSGEVLGGLFFGHPEENVFTEREERIAVGLAAQAAIAMDNARLYEAERRARAEAEAANHAKDEFLAMLGHELRNPIGAISNSIYALRAKSPTERGDALHEVIARQTGRLARLVDDLLDVARLTSGKVKLYREPIDLATVAAGCVDSARARDRVRHDISLEAEPAWVDGDRTRLEQIVDNLLDNAAKYTPDGGSIRVRVGSRDDTAIVRVSDTGQGIEAEMIPRIFDVFSQGVQALDRSPGGLGVGLALVKRLTELHGGTVTANSDGPGGGSEFIVRLPKRKSPEENGARPPESSRGASRRILVVEDYADAREALRMLLELWGHQVEIAKDGTEGLAKALALKPDVAILDIGLPGLDGYQLAERLRQSELGDDIVLVALTGYGQPYDRERALESKFDAHLVKPLDHDALSRLLAGLAAR